jgi:hypothetical protein
VKHKWEPKEALDRQFCYQGEAGHRSHQSMGLEMPSEQRGNEIPEAKNVEGATQDGTRDAVGDGGDPGDLWAINAEMRGDGPSETLFGENFVPFGRVQWFGRNRSVEA